MDHAHLRCRGRLTAVRRFGLDSRLSGTRTGTTTGRDQWSTGIQSELDFWARWLETKGLQYQDDYIYRTDPNAELRFAVRKCLEAFTGTPKVLDVGAGPMTYLGKRLNGRPIDLTAVDALAEAYDQLPFPPGLPLVRTQQCETERLREKFAADTFDLTHAHNTLDHSYDPVAGILQMIEVTKPGGLIVTSHAANEALNEHWQGFHQWNFHVQDRDFLVSNRTQTFSVSKAIAGRAEILDLSLDGGPRVDCVMRRVTSRSKLMRMLTSRWPLRAGKRDLWRTPSI